MDDPTRWCENDASNGNAPSGAPGPKRGPHFFVPPILFLPPKTTHLVDPASHGDARLCEHVRDLRFAQSGRVIFK